MIENNSPQYQPGAASLFASAAREIDLLPLEEQIKKNLDLLAEYESNKEKIESNKRALLDEVKIPADVEALVAEGMKRMADIESGFAPQYQALRNGANLLLSEIVIPKDIIAAMKEIDRKRDEIREQLSKEEKEITCAVAKAKTNLQAEIEAKTKQVYADIARRKAEIEAEFAGHRAAVEKNINDLTATIKDMVKKHKDAVKGTYFHAIYVRGRVTWNTDKMEAWMHDHPFLGEARKEGEPSVTIKKL